MVIGSTPKCISGPCLHWTDPLNCSVYKEIPDNILFGKTCKFYVDKARKK